MEIHKLIQQLEELDWTQQEATLYVTLLQLGPQPASVIARRIKRNRITTYHALERLVERKIAESTIEKNVVYYFAKTPQILLEQIADEKKKMIRNFDLEIENLRWISPHLEKLKVQDIIRPKVQIFHGEDALKSIYLLSLEAKFMLAYFQPWPKNKEKLLNDIDDWHTEERIKRKIPIKILIPSTKEGIEFATVKKDLKESIVVPSELLPFKDVTIITDSRILIFSLQELIGVAIESKHMADNQRAIFNLAWAGAKSLS